MMRLPNGEANVLDKKLDKPDKGEHGFEKHFSKGELGKFKWIHHCKKCEELQKRPNMSKVVEMLGDMLKQHKFENRQKR
jgi:hypothetical protein